MLGFGYHFCLNSTDPPSYLYVPLAIHLFQLPLLHVRRNHYLRPPVESRRPIWIIQRSSHSVDSMRCQRAHLSASLIMVSDSTASRQIDVMMIIMFSPRAVYTSCGDCAWRSHATNFWRSRWVISIRGNFKWLLLDQLVSAACSYPVSNERVTIGLKWTVIQRSNRDWLTVLIYSL